MSQLDVVLQNQMRHTPKSGPHLRTIGESEGGEE